MLIKKKIWPEFFEAIKSGKKRFEIRLGDIDVNEGDILELEEFNPETKNYTGRKIEKKVSYLLKTKDIDFWPKEDINKLGLVIMSLEDVYS
jgi:ASC-1-like (ASCH) protein